MIINKDLLRQAICDGTFSNGNVFGNAVTPEILAKISLMKDEEVEKQLKNYVGNKRVQLKNSLNLANVQVANVQAQMDKLDKMVASISSSVTVGASVAEVAK